jgi:hypothetical protein
MQQLLEVSDVCNSVPDERSGQWYHEIRLIILLTARYRSNDIRSRVLPRIQQSRYVRLSIPRLPTMH